MMIFVQSKYNRLTTMFQTECCCRLIYCVYHNVVTLFVMYCFVAENEQEKPDNEGSTLYWVFIAVVLIVLLIAFIICLWKKKEECKMMTEGSITMA